MHHSFKRGERVERVRGVEFTESAKLVQSAALVISRTFHPDITP